MLYLWESPEISDKYTAVYDSQVSPDRYLLMKSKKVDFTNFSTCDAYLRSRPLDLPDDPFIIYQLRKTYHSSYIFSPENLYYCASGIVDEIKINKVELNKLKEELFTYQEIDQSTKPLTDVQLQKIFQIKNCPNFSRIPIFNSEVTINLLGQFDCIPNTTGIPLVNNKIINLLLELIPEEELQFFDTKIRCKDGSLSEYKLVNIIPKINGIDHDKSIYTKMVSCDAILRFKYLTYKSGCMGDFKIARDEEYLSNILITEDLKNAFEKAKIKGVWFVRPEDFYRPMRPEDLID